MAGPGRAVATVLLLLAGGASAVSQYRCESIEFVQHVVSDRADGAAETYANDLDGDGDIDMPGVDAEDLRVADAFVVRYVHEAGEAASLPTHVDGGLVSVNIGLNDAFEGGGTRFERTGRVVRGGEGSVVVHPSAVRHAGEPITSGVRVILVVFCISRRAPELCRRFTNEGIAAGAAGDAAASTLAFRRATKFDAANVAARQNLATNRFNAGGFDGLKAAATDLRRCVALEGGDACRNVDVLARLGEAAHALGAYAQALAVSSWLLDVAPEDFCGHVAESDP